MGDNPKKFIGREGGVFVYILHFIILNNLYSERVLLVLFGSRGQIPLLRDQMTVKKQQLALVNIPLTPSRQEIEISMSHNFPLIPNSPLITVE